MCGRTTNTLPRDELVASLGVAEVDAPELPISWNVAPSQPVYVMGAGPDRARKLKALRWGLVPHWAKDARSAYINARAETIADKPVFRGCLASKRVIVPLSGFYEWRRPGLGEKAPRQPFYFQSAHRSLLGVAAIWDLWRDAEGHKLRSVALVTTEANSTMQPVHGRMPALLPPEAWDEWIRPAPLAPGRLERLLVPAPEGLLECWEVGPRVNSVKNDGADLVEPVAL